jgi:hypothetical protein
MSFRPTRAGAMLRARGKRPASRSWRTLALTAEEADATRLTNEGQVTRPWEL